MINTFSEPHGKALFMSQKTHWHERKSLFEGKVHRVWKKSRMRQAKREREFGFKMSRTSVPRWCNGILQLNTEGASCFYKMDQTLHLGVALEGQAQTCSMQTWKWTHPIKEYTWIINNTEANPLHTPSPTQQRKAFVQSYWCKAHTCAFTGTKQVWRHRHMAWCPVIPDPHSRTAAKKKPPHTLIWSESAERGTVPCRLSAGL